ncbi:RICIN domain-containing protein [Nonomuraea sp. PA05]|uniref:RICIN domain-containing protein n=1 Tax=Nonomuraea sp. PA05 TaxID=2604466 RepID=UPI003983D1D3
MTRCTPPWAPVTSAAPPWRRTRADAWPYQGGTTASGTQLIQYACGGGSEQAFTFKRAGAKIYTIVNVKSGKCLAVSGAGTSNGAAVVQESCAGTAAQRFELKLVSGTQGYLLRPTHSYKCAEVTGAQTANSAKVVQNACQADPLVKKNQVWRLSGVPGHL